MNYQNWMQATEFLAAALSSPPKTPLNQEQLDRIDRMDISPHSVQVWLDKGKRSAFANACLLQQPQPFERLQKLSCLHITNADQSIGWKRILRGLAGLPQVKELTLSCTADATSTEFPLKELAPLCTNIQTLEAEQLSPQALAQLPRTMPQLQRLVINSAVDWQLLSQFQLPNLKRLHLHHLTGLRSLSQISLTFPQLEWLILENVNTLDGMPLELGELSPSLYHLDLSAEELAHWQLAPNLTEMRIQNCCFDPSFLQTWNQLTVLELKNDLLEAPIPSLAGCKEMNYLIVNGCAVTDFSFAKGLHQLQIFNVEGNGIDISPALEENQLPEPLSCLAEMPQLLEFVIEERAMNILLENCPKLFARYQAVLPDMLRLKHR